MAVSMTRRGIRRRIHSNLPSFQRVHCCVCGMVRGHGYALPKNISRSIVIDVQNPSSSRNVPRNGTLLAARVYDQQHMAKEIRMLKIASSCCPLPQSRFFRHLFLVLRRSLQSQDRRCRKQRRWSFLCFCRFPDEHQFGRRMMSLLPFAPQPSSCASIASFAFSMICAMCCMAGL